MLDVDSTMGSTAVPAALDVQRIVRNAMQSPLLATTHQSGTCFRHAFDRDAMLLSGDPAKSATRPARKERWDYKRTDLPGGHDVGFSSDMVRNHGHKRLLSPSHAGLRYGP